MRRPSSITSALLRSRWWLVPLILLLALFLPGADQGWYRTDTHYYAAIASQAWESAAAQGSIRPLLDLRAGDQVYMNKPPLVFIVHGLFVHLLGLSLWSVRLGSLLAAMLACVATSVLVRRLGGWRIALLTGIVLATSVEFFRYTRAISLDLWQCAFVMVMLAMFVRGLPRRDEAWTRTGMNWALGAGVPLGLALLCKPFMALLAPLLLGAWLIASRQRGWIAPWLGLLTVALAVAVPWHVWMWSVHGDAFIDTYVMSQSIDRAIGAPDRADMPGISEPWWYYLHVVAEGYWPWLVTFALALFAWVGGKVGPTPAQRRLLMLGAIWSLAWLVVLSAFGGKSARYMVIIWPLLSVVSGWWIVRAGAGSRGTGRTFGRLAINGLAPVALAIAIVVALSGARMHKPRDPAWDKLLAELDAHPDRPLTTTPRGHHSAANLVMLGRAWPTIPVPPTPPAPNSYVLYHPDEIDGASVNGQIVLTSADFVLVHIKP